MRTRYGQRNALILTGILCGILGLTLGVSIGAYLAAVVADARVKTFLEETR